MKKIIQYPRMSGDLYDTKNGLNGIMSRIHDMANKIPVNKSSFIHVPKKKKQKVSVTTDPSVAEPEHPVISENKKPKKQTLPEGPFTKCIFFTKEIRSTEPEPEPMEIN
ncbi:hypothetical protein AL387_gp039 [Salmon gill poxvirus]|uniref:Uncharacterized protein n=1 Tax=Salmon gill poxvirus TaxID=1680908 RepID=A0A0H4XWE3_9POXV|nr:hypothetical protein AL387_gp039 [Salmon gill poxvirus]AKR04163.1 hypothetical protein SGPV039 [Salmon gill poxvirus]